MEKAKAFFLMCAGILMLSIAIDIGTDQAKADFDPEAGGPVIAFQGFENHGYVLLDSGECWHATDGEWQRQATYDLPIPLSEVAFYEASCFIATNGDFWYQLSGEWVNIGSPPIGTPAENSNWSQLKSNFGGK